MDLKAVRERGGEFQCLIIIGLPTPPTIYPSLSHPPPPPPPTLPIGTNNGKRATAAVATRASMTDDVLGQAQTLVRESAAVVESRKRKHGGVERTDGLLRGTLAATRSAPGFTPEIRVAAEALIRGEQSSRGGECAR